MKHLRKARDAACFVFQMDNFTKDYGPKMERMELDRKVPASVLARRAGISFASWEAPKTQPRFGVRFLHF